MALHQRLLHDIAELQSKPYPNISFIPHEDITKGCLILTPNGERPLHLTVDCGSKYPLFAPSVKMDSSDVHHPNIFSSYICASILNTKEGYTPAYTLKGIAIQLLSFFGSDTIEQAYGNHNVNLAIYRKGSHNFVELHRCRICSFGLPGVTAWSPEVRNRAMSVPALTTQKTFQVAVPTVPSSPLIERARQGALDPRMLEQATPSVKVVTPKVPRERCFMATLPDEVLLVLCEYIEDEELMLFARAWNRIGSSNGIISKYNIVRSRELQCFCLKKNFREADTKLGVGVSVNAAGRQGKIESEFDLVSRQAFEEFAIRRSVQGRSFRYWLPLPISRRHFEKVKSYVDNALIDIGLAANISASSLSGTVPANVLYSFMNDIVVKLSTQVAESSTSTGYSYDRSGVHTSRVESTLKHASDKAIESYYYLFHLLVCLANSDDSIVRAANRTLEGFLRGRTSKTEVPNLGSLLVAVLVSDFDMTPNLTMAIIKETVTRNVVWMLDGAAGGHAELSYMESDAISEYRLAKTFEASKTSYRLLMFLNIFRQTVNRGVGADRKSLAQLRDEMFDAHGASPRGTATNLAHRIKHLQTLNSFPEFLRVMGVKEVPRASEFTTFLRDCVEDSVKKGYSKWAMRQDEVLRLRQAVEPGVGVRPIELQKQEWQGVGGSFFPGKTGGRGGRRRRGERGDR